MELNTLFLEEIRDQLSLGHIQKFKVHKVSLSDQHEESNSKDSTSCTGDIESVRQINTIDFAGNAMHCELVDRRIRRTMRSRSNKLRKVSLRRKSKTRCPTILYILLVLLFLTNICCVCFPVDRPPNSLAVLDIVHKDVVTPVQHWKPVEATFANLRLNYNILVPSNTMSHCKDAELLVFIAIRPHSFDTRQTIRSTWASPENIGKKTMVKFAIGHPNDERTMQQIFEEQETFNDLILYDHPDEYRQLYIKIHAAFNWQQSVCPNVKYIFRADDDIVVDLPRLRYWIDKEASVAQKNDPAVLFGKIRWHDKNIFRNPNHKWYISEKDFPHKMFPHFAYGWATLYSNEAVKAMLQHAHETNSFAVEDVFYSGVLAEKASVRKIDFSRHFKSNRSRGILLECDNEKVPFVTVVCCFHSHSDIVRAYKKLKIIKCPRRNAHLFYSSYIKM